MMATFAAGCFWHVEAAFRRVPGVVDARAGYTGGTARDPTYEEVCGDATGHAEAVRVEYDPGRVTYAELLEAFWSCHDPTTPGRQGPDVGSQYRSAIFAHGADQEEEARRSMEEAGRSGRFAAPIVTEIRRAPEFYEAEGYHQRYLERRGMA